MIKRVIYIIISSFLIVFLISCSSMKKDENYNVVLKENTDQLRENINFDTGINNDLIIQESLKIIETDKPAILSGAGSKEFPLMMQEGGYRFIIKSKEDSQAIKHLYLIDQESGISIPMYISLYAGKGEADWFVYETVEHKYYLENLVVDIEADGIYEVEIYKLPEANTIPLPITFKGSGTRIIGPFNSEGEININMQSLDTKLTGFLVSIKDAMSGQPSGYVFMNIGPDGKEFLKDFNITKSISPEGSGAYYLSVMANGLCNWEINISKK